VFYTIYKITNLLNNKIYIGKHQTKDLNDGYMGSGKHLKHATMKYGTENFIKQILFVFDNENEMNAKEAELVTEEFILREDTYNICIGGNGGFGYINTCGLRSGFENRPEINAELNSRAINKIKVLRETDDKWNQNFKKSVSQGLINYFKTHQAHFSGKTHTEESKEKMRKPRNQGSKNSQFGTMWITNGKENKKIKKDDYIPDGWYGGRVTKN